MTYSQVDTLADTDLVQLIKNDGSAAQITGASLKTALTKTVTNTVTVTVSALETPTLVFTPTGALDICPPGTVLGTLSLSGATATSYFGARGYLQTGRARVTPGTNQVVRDVLRKTKINPTQTCRFGATYVDTNGFMQTVYVDTLLGVALTSDPGTQGLSNARVISQVTLAEHAPPLTEVAILAADSVNPNYDPAYADYQPTGDGALHKFTPEKNPRDIDGHFRLLSRGDIALATKGSYSVPIVFKTAKGATVTLPVTINIVPATPEKIAEQAGVNLLAHWDNSVASTLTLNGSSVLSQTTVDGTQTFRASGSGVTYIPAGQNGRDRNSPRAGFKSPSGVHDFYNRVSPIAGNEFGSSGIVWRVQ